MDVNVYESIRSAGVCPGMVVISDAGHDKGMIYLVTEVKNRFAYLADGRRRRSDHPKKKRVTHIKVLGMTKDAHEITEKLYKAEKAETKDIIIRESISVFLKQNGNSGQ